MADRVPPALASRLRAARGDSGLSQGAVADEMVRRGFSWRQSTVAKSEAADRPVLFAEVAALALIYDKSLEYFLAPAEGLDAALDNVHRRIKETSNRYARLRFEEEGVRRKLVTFEGVYTMGRLIKTYSESGDEGDLVIPVRDLFIRHNHALLNPSEVYEAVGIDALDLEQIDADSLMAAAKDLAERYSELSQQELMDESGAMLNELDDFINGKGATPDFIAFLHEGTEWPLFAAGKLIALITHRLAHQKRLF